MIFKMYHTYARRATDGCMFEAAGISHPSALSYPGGEEYGVRLHGEKGGGWWR
jgi:hypothetical protein